MENQLSMHDVVPVFYVDPAYYYYEPQLGTEKKLQLKIRI